MKKYSLGGFLALVILGVIGFFEMHGNVVASPCGPAGSCSGAISVDTNTNNVSFGTSTPDVNSNMLVVGSSSANYVLRLASSSGSNLFYVDKSGTVWFSGAINGGQVVATNVAAGQFGANTGGGNYSFPANVGIGGTSGAKLTVNGAGAVAIMGSRAAGSDYQNSALTLGYDSSGNVAWLQGYGASAATTLALNPQGGNVGIGTTNPSDLMTVDQKGVAGKGYTLTNNGTAVATLQNGSTGGTNGIFTLYSGTTPTVQLYAYAGSGGASYIMNNVGIGKTNPGYLLDVNGDINFTGTLRQNGSPFAASQWTTSGNNIYNSNSGNVGIGTTNPLYKLHIIGGDVYFQNSNDTLGGSGIFMGNTSSPSWDIRQSFSGNNLAIDRNNGSWSNVMTILNASGNVGIGTTAPAYKLDVNGTARFVGETIVPTPINPSDAATKSYVDTSVGGVTNTNSGSSDLNTLTSSGFYRINNTNLNRPNDWGQLLVIHGAADTITQVYGDYGTGTLYTRSGNPSNVGGAGSWTGWNQLIMANSSGNVGIGTTGPAYKLDVSGTVNATQYCVNGSGCVTSLSGGTVPAQNVSAGSFGANTGGGNYTFPAQVSAGNFYVPGLGQGQIVLNASGAYYGNISNPGGQVWSLGYSTGGTSIGTSVLSWTASGNVGIGTTAPGVKLDVSGDVRASGVLTLNGGSSSNWASLNVGGTSSINAGGNIYSYGRICAGNNSGNCDSSSGVVLAGSGSNAYGNVYLTGSGNTYFNSGNVGIGTTGPTYKLDVQGGQVNASGGLCINGDCKTAWNQVSGATYYAGTGVVLSGTTFGIDTAGWDNITTRAPYNAGPGSGFYQTSLASAANGWPAGAGGWWHLINSQHTNGANNYALQISGSFYDQNFYMRKTNNNGAQAWSRVITTDPGSTNTTMPGSLTGSGSASSYGAIGINGSKNGWAGINFPGSGTLMMSGGYSGFFNAADNGWRWYVEDNGNEHVSGNSSIAGKLTVSTIDPVYTIGGTNYATYVSGMTGQKEETAGMLVLTCKSGEKCSKTIDFLGAPQGSDLWLFARATNLKAQFDKMIVSLTPSFDGQVWYAKNKDNTLTVFARSPNSGDLEVSYRFIAPRFDAASWTNYADPNEKGFNLNGE